VQKSFRNIVCSLSIALSAFAAGFSEDARAIDTLDIDANGSSEALTDGILVIRYLFGMRGPGLVQGAIGPGAARSTAQIESYLDGIVNSSLDIDGNAKVDALTDGLLALRYLFGIRGAQLVQGTIGTGATRTTSSAIENYLATLVTPPVQQVQPFGCTVTASPASSLSSPLPPSTVVTLTANCTNGTQPITYTWNNGQTGSVRTVNPSITTTYSVVGSNSVGNSPTASRTVYVTAPTTVGYCTTIDDQYDAAWPMTQVKLATNGFTTQVVSFRINVPTTFNPPNNPNHTGAIRIAEVPGRPAITREVTISHTPCDFHAGPGGYIWDDLGQQNGQGFLFTVNNPTNYAAVGGNVNFQPGETLYVNIRNYNYNNGNPQPTCPGGQTCDLFFDFIVPLP
jgi:hypothetical protein